MGNTRLSWGFTVVTLLATATALLLVSTPTQATPARAVATEGSLRVSAATVAPGSPITLRGTLPPRRARMVKLQAFRDGSWTVLETRTSTRRGTFRFTTTSASKPGSRDYRVLAPAIRIGGTRYPSVVTPRRSVTSVAMVAAASGWRHSCALGSNGQAWCWGSNEYGELGDGTGGNGQGTQVSRPVRVIGDGWTDLSAAGATMCGLQDDGSAWCWGDGATYLFGDGWVTAPEQLSGTWSQVSAGWFYTCGVHTDRTGWCQGRNEAGQLGVSGTTSPTTPVQVPGEWREIVAGDGDPDATTCGIKVDGSAWCWGQGDHGQLGNDASTDSSTPVEVGGDHAWASVTVGAHHVCGVDTDGAAWCWGENTDGRLGDGTNLNERDVPVRVSGPASWRSLDAGFQHTCGVTSDGEGWCWGWNDHGQLGNGTHQTTYFPVPDPSRLPGRWTDLDAALHGSSGTRVAGSAWAWGEGTYGALGDGAADRLDDPVEVAVLR